MMLRSRGGALVRDSVPYGSGLSKRFRTFLIRISTRFSFGLVFSTRFRTSQFQIKTIFRTLQLRSSNLRGFSLCFFLHELFLHKRRNPFSTKT